MKIIGIGIIGLGDLSKSLIPLLKPFSDKISVYDPWVPNKIISDQGMESISLNKMFGSCDVIYVLAAITKNKNKIVLLSAIDNLIKGGAGQAIQNMNIFFNFLESKGLR